MELETALSLAETQENGAKYDASVKAFFKHKEAVAPILARVVREYAGYTNKEIAGFIDQDIRAEGDPVSDLSKEIINRNIELKSIVEKTLFYDFKFEAKNPRLSDDKFLVMLHIDLEFQNKNYESSLKYPIEMRAMYYAARELSSQLPIASEDSQYGKLEKVYSIWVCNENIPAEFRDTITRYCLKKEDLLGTVPVDRRFDLMEVVIIRRGGDNTSGDTLLDYLEGVFGNDRAKVEGYLGPVNETVMEDYTMLTGFAHSLEARAEAQTEAKIYNNIVARLKEQHPDWSEQQITDEAEALIGVL